MKQFESGRSMVEMLGTLAIVGVLSIGGIAGYSYGIDKYHANAIVNDVNLRAVDLLSQLSQGHTPNLDLWETTSAGQYPISLNSDNAPTNYYINVKEVPFEVCNMIVDMMPENVRILVDNDTQACGEGDNILDFEYEGFEVNANPEDTCPTGTSARGLGGYASVMNSNNERCYCSSSGTKWDNSTSTCVTQPDICWGVSDCDNGEYCQFSISQSNLLPLDGGRCQSLSQCGEITSSGEYLMVKIGGEGCTLDWWTAQQICFTFGKQMVSPADIGCTQGGTCTSAELSNIRNAGFKGSFWLNAYDSGKYTKYLRGDDVVDIWLIFGEHYALCKDPN